MKKIIYLMAIFTGIIAFGQQEHSGGISIGTGFKLEDPQPIDDKYVVADSASLNSLPNVYEGLWSYSKADSAIFVYDGVKWNQIAKGGDLSNYFTKSETQDEISDSIKSIEKKEDLNLEYFQNFRFKSTSLLNGGSELLNVGLIGDSWTQSVPGAINYVQYISRKLRSTYGNGGGGFYDFSRSGTNDYMRSADIADATDSRTGTINYKDQTSDSKGVNLAHAEFTNGSTLTLNVLTAHQSFEIHYYSGATYGTFRYRIDGGSWETVDTSSTSGHQKILETVSDATHTLEFEVTSGTCILLGVDLQRNSGIRINKLGNRGSFAYDYGSVDSDNWKDAFSSLNLNSVSVLLGTNDRTQDRLPSDFGNDIEYILDLIEDTDEFIDLALISPSNNEVVADYDMIDYSDELYDIAKKRKVSFISLIPLFGTVEKLTDEGYFYDANHPTVNGGNMIAEWLLRNLFSTNTSSDYVVKSGRTYQNIDGKIEVDELSVKGNSNGGYVYSEIYNLSITGSARMNFKNGNVDWSSGVNIFNDYRVRNETTSRNIFNIDEATLANTLNLTSSGVGIYVASPTAALDVLGNAKITGNLKLEGGTYPVLEVVRNTTDGATGNLANLTGIASGSKYTTKSSTTTVDGFGGGLILELIDASTSRGVIRFLARQDGAGAGWQILTGTTPVLTGRQNGRLGIGTTNPSQMLDVNGSIAFSGTIAKIGGSADNILLEDGTTLDKTTLVIPVIYDLEDFTLPAMSSPPAQNSFSPITILSSTEIPDNMIDWEITWTDSGIHYKLSSIGDYNVELRESGGDIQISGQTRSQSSIAVDDTTNEPKIIFYVKPE